MGITNDIMFITNSITNQINTNISDEVEKLLKTIFINNRTSVIETNSYTKDLYKLIIYFSKSNPNASIKIMSGFIKFGKSNTGKQYKPMIDYFMMESVDLLLNECGWSIIKPLLNMLRENIKKLQKDSTFNYISNKIIKQINEDRTSVKIVQEQEQEQPEPISNLCYYMPREKSFTFGWYSYYIACKLYGNKHYYNQSIKKTDIRHYLMNYRKMINELCCNIVIMKPDEDNKTVHAEIVHAETVHAEIVHAETVHAETVHAETLHIDLNYSDLQTEFNKPHYKRVNEIIETVLPTEEVPTEGVPTEGVPTEEVPTEEVPIEGVPTEEVSTEGVPIEEVPIEEVPIEVSLTPPKEEEVIIKNENKWFSGWFSGWM